MKKLLSLATGVVAATALYAQAPGIATAVDPVQWSISQVDEGSGTWSVIFRADIEPGWYVYSQQNFGEMGPLPTSLAFDPLPTVQLQGAPLEEGEHMIQGHDPFFEMEVKKFKGHALFTQRLTVSDANVPITGRLDYQSCNDASCTFPAPIYFKIFLSEARSEFAPLPYTSVDADDATDMLEPVSWSIAPKEIAGRPALAFTATVMKGWYIYSQESFGDGPIPTSITIDSLPHVKAFGKALEEGTDKHEGMDEMFGINVRKYGASATFTQALEVTDRAQDITGVINYMTCDDGKCIFPDPLRFRVNLSTGMVQVGDEPPASGSGIMVQGAYKLQEVDLSNPVIRASDESIAVSRGQASLWRIILLGFIGGLLALLTPCVFPMIPLTVSFFTKGSDDKAKGLRNAITYGGFILGIYLLFSLPFHLLGSVNPEIFNEISTNPWLNIFFFVIFIVFAISFFGYFEITLPSSWVNRMDQNASRFGGQIGIFFMALTLALVSFSCTGPILGSLLAGALTADGGAWQLTAGMGGFGLALALPFALFALFPGWLNSLPRSGSWLNSVKVVLGFAEIALAFKFLSNADLVKHWGLIRYEVFMAVWVLCGLGIVVYLLGRLRFPHDSPLKRVSPLRWAFTGLFGLATVYMLMGFRYNEESRTFTVLKWMSGLAPPVGYSWIHPKECPSNLDCFHDLDAALVQAKRTRKPLLIDFTGYACVNCRKMEEHVWPVAGVHKLIAREYVLVSLYVDDKEELPKEQQHVYVTSTGKQKAIVTRGNKWSTIQTETFINNSQPFYALLSPEGKLLTDPVAYTPDASEYEAFLQRGLQGMRSLDEQANNK